jgi:hypothetical protein
MYLGIVSATGASANAWVRVTYRGYDSAVAAAVHSYPCTSTSRTPCNDSSPNALVSAGVQTLSGTLYDQVFIEPIKVCPVTSAPNYQPDQWITFDAWLYYWNTSTGTWVKSRHFQQAAEAINGSGRCLIFGDDFNKGSGTTTSSSPAKFQNVAPGYYYTAYYNISWTSYVFGTMLAHAHFYFDVPTNMQCATFAVQQRRCYPNPNQGPSYSTGSGGNFLYNPSDFLFLN